MNIKIKNKFQSMNYIEKFNLNTLPEKYFEKYDRKQIIDFLKKYPANFYAVRVKEQINSSKHILALSYEEVPNYCKNLENFTLNVSSYCYKENQILTGKIRIYDDMSIEYILSNVKGYSVRDCYDNPDYIGIADIYDKKLLSIKRN